MTFHLSQLFALENFGIKLGLENISRLCEALGHPEEAFTALHVAGTNGKGSVTAMTHAALMAAGIRTARYTSPHLTDITERFVIGPDAVEPALLEATAADVMACIDRLRAEGTLTVAPTFFEATTAIAFELFRRAEVEVGVIEVGLGGRFDATNVIKPAAAAITTIALDHQQHLGDTLAAIAFEKAGIIKDGLPVVTGAIAPEALEVIRRAAAERGARLLETARDTRAEVEMREGRALVTVQTPQDTYGPILLGLRGEHQVANAVVAIRLLEAARDVGVDVRREAIEEGLSTVEWPARLELLTLESGKRVLLDAAHNAEGAAALADYLRRWHPELPPLVIGVSNDKDVDAILSALVPLTSRIVATAAPTVRAMSAADLADRARLVAERLGVDPIIAAESDPAAAVADALATADTICIAGSIFLAGAVRGGLRRRAILH